MKKILLGAACFIAGVAFIINCGGGTSPAPTNADDPVQLSITELQGKLDVLSLRIEALEKDNNYSLAERIKGTWSLTAINRSVNINIVFDGSSLTCNYEPAIKDMSGQALNFCDGAPRDYTIDVGMLIMKNSVGCKFGSTTEPGDCYIPVAISDNGITLSVSGPAWHGTKK